VPDSNLPSASVFERGPSPTETRIPRWTLRADVPTRPLPPVFEYSCKRIGTPPAIEGDVDATPWPWSDPFRHIATGDEVPHLSRAAFLWDDDYLYAAFDFVDPGREAIATEPGSHVYVWDNDAEVLVSGPGGYYEIGVNSIGTSYEVAWTWVERLVDAGDKAAIDRLFRLPNFLYYAPQGDHQIGRVGDLDFRLPGLRHTERWEERHGKPGWTSQMAFPWSSLAPVLGLDGPPAAGQELRLQAYRAQHEKATAEEIAAAEAAHGKGASPATAWTWSVQGNHNVHNLERWAVVTLTDEEAAS
jgi:hypothetical protein